MASPAQDLERVLGAFRREQALGYLRVLSGAPEPVRAYGARSLLTSERGQELIQAARESGELSPDALAGSLAHVARAQLEVGFREGRALTSGLLGREVSVEGDTRSLHELVGQWLGQSKVNAREAQLRAMGPELEAYVEAVLWERSDSDRELAAWFQRERPPRHPDAGPDGGSAALAESWLVQTEELTREALSHAQRALRNEGQGALDNLWSALGLEMHGLVPREGRLRRLALEWEPLGLRRLLAARARSAPPHPGPFLSPQLLVVDGPVDVRVAQAGREFGLASELAMAEAIGRALAYTHASAALPLGLRVPSVGSVARGIGSLAVQRLLEPRFWRRMRGLSVRESELVARRSALFFLLDSRVAAAALLARNVSGSDALDQLAPFLERAWLGPAPRGPAAAMLLRAAPGGALRGKVHGPALAFALRERFDEDWYLNPRSAEPLRGAMARAGELSIEQFAEELTCVPAHGVEKLSELF